MSPAEKECFHALVAAKGHEFCIFPQVHISHLVNGKIYGQNWRGAYRHIDEKSVDFVLCTKSDLSPVLAIELDDHSHDTPTRVARDSEVERIFREVKLPLLRLQNHGSFDPSELSQFITRSLQRD